MDNALINQEFLVYISKNIYSVPVMYGAEALLREATGAGSLPPNTFLLSLKKTDFIQKLVFCFLKMFAVFCKVDERRA